ncbi:MULTISPECIES: hypothetical protein [unclassified Streptomyces]|uniref:hypothetical protein n=1 Tax=unclassified Streptomyces TaxID=2593676 RepID=UPI0033AB8524
MTMLPGSGLDLTRLTPGERDHLSLTGLDEKQRAELNASVESRRALSKLAATQSRRVHELLPLTDVVHVDSRPWLQARASGTTPASLIGRGIVLRDLHWTPHPPPTGGTVVSLLYGYLLTEVREAGFVAADSGRSMIFVEPSGSRRYSSRYGGGSSVRRQHRTPRIPTGAVLG